MRLSKFSGFLSLVFLLLGITDLSGQTYRIRAVVESVQANFPYGDEHDGIVDITWKVNGTLDRGRGRKQSLNSFGIHLNRPTGFISSVRNHVLIDQTFSGGGLDLCNDKLTLQLNFESFENDCDGALTYNGWASSACSFFNPDDYHRTGGRTIVLNQYDAGQSGGRQIVRLGGDIYTYNIFFFYELVNPIRALEIEGAANVICEGSDLSLVARTGDGFTGGTFAWLRRPVGGGAWTRLFFSRSNRYVVSASDLTNFDYGVRLQPGTTIFGQCAGDFDLIRSVEKANLTIVKALQSLPITTTPACAGQSGGSITYQGPSSVSDLRVRLSLDGPTVRPAVEIDADGTHTFESLASGNYTLKATTISVNGEDVTNGNCTIERRNIPIALAPVPELLSVSGFGPGCGGGQGRILMTVKEGTGTGFRFRIEGIGASAGEPTREVPENSDGFIGSAGTFALENVNPGTYRVTATNVTGCVSAPATVTVAPPPPPATGTIAWTPDDPGVVDIACKGDRKVVTVSVPASQGATRVRLSRSGGFSPQFDAVLPGGGSGTTSVNAGTYDITFTVVSTGCTATFTRTLTEAANTFSAVRTSTIDATSCMPSGGSVTAEVFNGTPPYTLQYFGASSGTLSQSESVFNVMNLARGSYSLLFTDANGCQAISGAFINSSSPLFVSPRTSSSPCAGENGTISVIISGGALPYNITVSDIAPTPSTQTQYNDVPPGRYTVTVTDANGCMEVRQVTVEDVDPLIVSDVRVENLPCEGNLARLSFTITGREIEFIPPGGEGFCFGGEQYNVSLDGGATWQDVTDNYTVSFDPIFADDESVICSKEATIFYDVVPGDYNVLVRLRSNLSCTSNTVAVSATEFDIPPVLTAAVTEVTPTTCGLDNGALTVEFGDGVGGDYTIELYEASVGEGGAFAVQTVTLSEAGSHTFFNLPAYDTPGYGLIIKRGGCTFNIPEGFNIFFSTSGIPLPATPSVDLTEITNTGPELECDDSGAEITVTGVSGGMPPYEYGLVLGDFGPSNVLYPTDPFNTRAYVRDANGCIDSLNFSDFQRKVVIHDLTITPTTPASTCSDGALQVTIQNGQPPYQLRLIDIEDDVTIRDLTVAGNTAELNGIAAGAYRFIVVDTFTCETAVEYDFAVTPPLTAVTVEKAPPTCESISNGRITISVSGGMAPYRIFYLGVESVGAERTITDLDADEYTFVIFDAFDCAFLYQDSIVASPFLSLTSSSTPPTPCGESPNGTLTVTPTGGTGPYSLSWLDDLDNPVVVPEGESFTRTGLGSGERTALITDQNGCEAYLGASISGPDTILATVNILQEPSCTAGGRLEILATGGDGTFTYAIADQPAQADSVFTDLAPGDYTFTITDGNGCSNQNTVTATIGPGTSIGASANTVSPSCGGQSDGQITVAVSGGTGPTTYSLNGGDPQSDPVFAGLPAGFYTVTVSRDGCTQTLTDVEVTEAPVLTLQANESTDPCTGVITYTLSATGGTGGYTYSLSGANQLTDNTFTLAGGDAGAGQVEDSNGCTASLTISAPAFSALMIDGEFITDAICDDGTGSLAVSVSGGTPPYRFQWSNGGPADSLFTGVSAGTYSVEVLDANDCRITSDPLNVRFIPGITVTANSNNANCGAADGTIILTASGGSDDYTYEFSASVFVTDNISAGLSAGTYTFTVTDNLSGCTVMGEETISTTDPPVISLDTQGPRGCVDNNGTATVSASGGTPGYTYLWTNGETGPVATQLSEGISAITVTDAVGCTDVITVDILIAEAPALSILSQTVTSCNAGDATATVSASGGTPNYTFTWSDGQSGPTASGLAAGAYTVTVTDANGCTNATEVTIEVATSPTLSLESQLPTECDGTNGSATVSASGGTPDYNYAWSNGENGLTAVALPSGMSTVTVTDARGCTDVLTVTIIERSSPILSLSSRAATSCDGSDGSATVTASGGTPEYTYAWEDGQTGATASNLAGGPISVTVTDAAGCTDVLSVDIEGITSPALTLVSQTATNCAGNGASATVTASGGTPDYTFTWSNGENGPTASDLPGGANSVTVTDANGCTDVLDLTIENTPSPTIAIDGQTTTGCAVNDGTATVSASGGTPNYTYTWSDGQSGPTASGLAAGAYTVTVTDANGCTNATEVTIEVATSPTLSLESQLPTECDGTNGSATVSASGGTPDYNYAWSNGENGLTAVALPSGMSTVTVTDARGCTDVLTVTIIERSSPILSLSSRAATSCDGSDGSATVTASGGTPEYTYAWEDGQTGATASNLAGGPISVTVTDAAGCTDVLSVDIEGITSPALTLVSQTATNCAGNGASATVTASGGTPDYTFTWSNGENGPTASDLPGGANSVTVTDANGCTDVLDLTIENTPSPTIAIDGQTTTGCAVNDGTATVSASGGTPNYTYTWSDGQSGPTASGLAAGAYTVTVTDANGCTNATEVTIEVATSPTLSLESQLPTECDGTNGSATVSASGGTPDYNYAWSNGENGLTAVALPSGMSTVTVTDARGCTDVLTVTIIERSSPILSLSSRAATSCDGSDGSATVSASGGTPDYTYAWEDGQTGATASNLAGGPISVTVTDATGCTDVLSVDIEGITSPTLTLVSQTATNCAGNGASATVTASGGTPDYTFTWSNGENGPTASDLPGGANSVTVTNGCTDVLDLTIENTPSPTIAIDGQTTTGCAVNDGTATVSASGGTPNYTYTWSDGQSGPTASGLAAGAYTVTVTDANGCTDATEVTIEVATSPTLSLESQLPTECDGTNGSATVSASGGTPDYNYAWSNGENGLTAVALPSGMSTVTVTDARGCTDVLTVTIIERSSPILSLSSRAATSCDGSDGSATVTASGGTPEYTYAWEDGQTGPTASNLAGGTISVTVTDAAGCTDDLTVTIEGITSPSLAISSQTTTSCNANDGTATVSASGGTPGYTYAWSNGETRPTATALASGPNTVTVTDDNGCTDEITVDIEETESPSLSILSQTATSCDATDGIATVSVSGGTPGYAFDWEDGQTGATASNLAGGLISVTVTDANGCTDEITVDIIQTNSPSLILESQEPTNCEGAGATATVRTTGGTPGYTYAWSNGETEATAINLAGGLNSVTVTDAAGCTNMLTVSIVTLSQPSLLLQNQTPTECDGTTGTATVMAENGTPGYTFAWSNGENGPTATELPVGLNSVTVTDATGCTNAIDVTIIQRTSPILTLAAQGPTNCEGEDGRARVNATGGTPGYTYAWENGQTSPSINGLQAGPISVTVTDAAGCTDALTIVIEGITSPSLTVNSQTPTSCDASDGSATVSAAGGLPDYTFAWSNGETGPTAIALPNGLASVTVTDTNGCTDEITIDIEQTSSPTLIIETQLPTSCDGTNGSATVSASGGTPVYSYVWSNGETGETANNLAGGVNFVTVTDASGCTDVLMLDITTLSRPSLLLQEQSPTDCDGTNGSATVQAENGNPDYTYAWSNGESGPTATELPGGASTVTVTDASGCTNSLMVTIVERTSPVLVVAAQGPTNCEGEDGRARVNATGGTPGYTYAWENGQTSPSINGLTAGPISVTVTDANGCTDEITVVIEGVTSPDLTLESQTPTNCEGTDGSATVSANGGMPDYTFAWSNGETGETASNLPGGTNTVTVTDVNGCTDELTVNIATLSQPDLTLQSQSPTDCDGTNGSATVQAENGNPDYTYAWSNGESGPTATELPGGSNTVTVTDASGCTNSLMVTIMERTRPVLVVAAQGPTNCEGEDGRARVNATGGTPGYTYAWENGQTSPSINGLTAGPISVTVTDANGCTDEITVVIEGVTSPDLTLESQTPTNCEGTDGSATVSANGGMPDYTFAWSNGETGETASNLPGGTNTVTVTDVNGCTDELTVNIATLSQPDLTLQSQSPTDCDGTNGSATVQAENGNPDYTYAWSNGESGPTATELPGGASTVTVTDASGCTNSLMVTIMERTRPVLVVAAQGPTNCEGEDGRARVNATGGTPGYTYAWENGQTSPSINGLTAGPISVTVTDANGCTDEITVVIEGVTSPVLTIISQTSASCDANDGTATVIATGGMPEYTYAWSNGETGPTATNLPGGMTMVTVTDGNSCTDIVTVDLDAAAAPVATVSTFTNAQCGESDGQITLSVQGGVPPFTYVWSHDTMLREAEASGLPAGDYSITVKDANDCISQVMQTITNTNGIIEETAIITDAFCNQASGTIETVFSGGTPPLNYTWSHEANLNSPTAEGLSSGDYSLTVTDVAGCTIEIQYTVGDSDVPEIISSEILPTSCTEGNGRIELSVSGGSSPFRYTWSHDSDLNEASASGLNSGNYRIEITDVNNCSVTAEVFVGFVEGPELTLTPVIQDCGSALSGVINSEITGGQAPLVYRWSNGDTTTNLTGVIAGTYTLTVTDANSCRTIVSATLPDTSPPEIELLSLTGEACSAALGTATFQLSQVSDASTISVLDQTAEITRGPLIGSTQTVQVNGLPAGTFSLSVMNENGCTQLFPFTIESIPAFSLVEANTNDVSCRGENDGSIVVSVLSSPGAETSFTYQWDAATGNQTGRTATNLSGGTYGVTATSSRGCTASLQIQVNEPDSELGLSITSTAASCEVAMDGSVSLAVSGGTAPYRYVWEGFPAVNGVTLSNLPSGTYSFTVTDDNGCTLAGESIVEDLQVIPVIALLDQTPETCAGDADASLTVSVSGVTTGLTYAWSNGGNTPNLTGLTGGETYELTVTSSAGCSAVESFSTESGAVLTLSDLASDTSVCSGNFYVIDLSDYPSRSITGPNGFSSTDEVSVLELPGQYVVTAADNQGCSVTDTTNLAVTADAFTARMVVASDAVITEPLVILEASFPAPTSVEWSISPEGATLSRQVNNLYYFDFSSPGTYDISLIAGTGGCEDVVTKRVTMHADSTTIPGLVLGTREILELTLSPSPNDGNFSVTAALNGPQPFTLSLFRSNGERIVSRRVENQTMIQESFSLDLEAGTYYLQAQAGNDRRVLAVVVF